MAYGMKMALVFRRMYSLAVGAWEYGSTFLDGVLLPMLLEILETYVEGATSFASVDTFFVHFDHRNRILGRAKIKILLIMMMCKSWCLI